MTPRHRPIARTREATGGARPFAPSPPVERSGGRTAVYHRGGLGQSSRGMVACACGGSFLRLAGANSSQSRVIEFEEQAAERARIRREQLERGRERYRIIGVEVAHFRL